MVLPARWLVAGLLSMSWSSVTVPAEPVLSIPAAIAGAIADPRGPAEQVERDPD